jgi:Cu/Ag efflux pump CusA
MLPIAAGLSGDSSFRRPMGIAVIGGLLASTALSLFVVPVIFTLMDDLQQKLRRATQFKRAPQTAAEAKAESA